MCKTPFLQEQLFGYSAQKLTEHLPVNAFIHFAYQKQQKNGFRNNDAILNPDKFQSMTASSVKSVLKIICAEVIATSSVNWISGGSRNGPIK